MKSLLSALARVLRSIRDFEDAEEALSQAQCILEDVFYTNVSRTKESMHRAIGEVLNILFDKGIVWDRQKYLDGENPPDAQELLRRLRTKSSGEF